MKKNRVVAYYGSFAFPRRGRPFQEVFIQYKARERFERVYKSFEFDSCVDPAGQLEIWRVILQIHFGTDPDPKILNLFKEPVGIMSCRITPKELDEYIKKRGRR